MRTLFRRLHLMTDLGTKLFVPVGLLTAVIVAMVAWVSAQALSREVTKQYEQRARGAAALFNHEFGETDLLQNSAELGRLICDLLASYPEFYRVTIYGQVGEVYQAIASTEPARVGAKAGAHDVEPLRTGNAYLREEVEEGHRILEIDYPLMRDGRPVATLGAYFLLADRDREVAALLREIAALAALTMAALLGIVYVVARTAVLAPLRSLLSATERATAGDLAVDILSGREETRRTGVRNEIVRFEKAFDDMVRVLRQNRDELRNLAIRDSLTGLHNRRYFEEIVQRELAQVERYGNPFAVAVIDVNGLRDVNNRFGHLAGDKLLLRTAEFLKHSVRASDEVMRWGGDEFLILMPHTNAAQAGLVAARLKAARAEHNARATGVPLGFSIGVSAWEPGRDVESILREADNRMYEEKRLLIR